MKTKENFFIIISGPTAVGKTDFVEILSKRFNVSNINIEIINADMGQLYRPLSIGTAKPDLAHVTVPHHLFDLLDEPVNYTSFAYRKAVAALLDGIWQRGNIPVIVGGSGFYISSLFFPQRPVATESAAIITNDPAYNLWDSLYAIDPKRAAEINKQDTYRITRALHIWHTTGCKPSEYTPTFDPVGNYFFIFLNRDRTDLYSRINTRTESMLAQGWLDEVANLSENWKLFLMQKKLIGYNDILQDKTDIKKLQEIIAQKTRAYAKRQIIFFRGLEKKLVCADKEAALIKKVQEVNLTLLDLDLYIDQLARELENLT